eukprot:9066228-Prorocentrum_lima.AAC.1
MRDVADGDFKLSIRFPMRVTQAYSDDSVARAASRLSDRQSIEVTGETFMATPRELGEICLL